MEATGSGGEPTEPRQPGPLKRWAFRLGAALVSLLLLLSLLELALRAGWRWMPPNAGNVIYGKYHLEPDGIFYLYHPLGIILMRQNYGVWNYFNGYRFWHQTDRYGFRNPESDRRPGIILLGDSFIYGHGVDEEQSVRNHLERLTGERVYNLSITGGCILQEYLLSKVYLEQFRPRDLFLFIFMNDPHDLRVLRSREQLASFWAVTEKEIDYRWVRAELTRLPDPQPAALDRLLYSFVATRFLKNLPFFFKRLDPPTPSTASDTPAAPPDPTALNFKYFILDDEFAIVQPFFTKALTVMAEDCRRQGVRFHVVQLPAIFCKEPAAFEARDKFRFFIRGICTGLELDYLDLTDRFTEGDFFPVDGHFSPAGHAALAAILADHLAAAPPPHHPFSTASVQR